MSRLGKKPLEIPEKTEVTVTNNTVSVKGPLGNLSLEYKSVIDVQVVEGQVILKPKNEELETMALWGTYSSLIKNMIQGVNKEFEVKLIIEGVGFKANVSGNKIIFNIGFSHPVEIEIPNGIKVTVEKSEIKITGIDKQAVNQFAAIIRATKKPEPYKGKGIRYSDEIIRRKEGKKTV